MRSLIALDKNRLIDTLYLVKTLGNLSGRLQQMVAMTRGRISKIGCTMIKVKPWMQVALIWFTIFWIYFAYKSVAFKRRAFLPDNADLNDDFNKHQTPWVLTDDREQLYKDRREVIVRGCAKLNRLVSHSLEFSNTEVDTFHHIYYCPIPKVGSTFWRRSLAAITSNKRLSSPYEIRLKDAELYKWNTLSERLRISLEKEGESFLFVRDPYARLFSGYENKIYHPSLSFWKTFGRRIVSTVRQPSNGQYLPYGYDVTFPEFIKYIIHQHEHNGDLNEHVKPMHQICDPCKTHYKYIGHLETFTDDAQYLLSTWRRKFDDVTLKFNDLYKEAAIDTAKSNLRFLYSVKPILPTIKFPFINLMLRTWRDLQIRGYISKNIEFPFQGDVSNVTESQLINEIENALALPQHRASVKLQRDEALVQAYRQVPLEDMEKLRKVVLTDCILFGYNDRPAQLFDRTQPINEEFLYLDGLSKTPYDTNNQSRQ